MRYTITCDGTPIGSLNLETVAGLAHGELEVLPAYASVRFAAYEAGQRFRSVGIWNTMYGDFAEEFARGWIGGRLALCDHTGAEFAVASIVIIDWQSSGDAWRPRVVIDARPDMARVEAFLLTLDRDGGGRSRPAA